MAKKDIKKSNSNILEMFYLDKSKVEHFIKQKKWLENMKDELEKIKEQLCKDCNKDDNKKKQYLITELEIRLNTINEELAKTNIKIYDIDKKNRKVELTIDKLSEEAKIILEKRYKDNLGWEKIEEIFIKRFDTGSLSTIKRKANQAIRYIIEDINISEEYKIENELKITSF